MADGGLKVALRRLQDMRDFDIPGWLPVAALAACALVGCDDDGSSGATPDAGQAKVQAQAKAVEQATKKMNERCEQLGQTCGQKDKHKETIAKECKEAAKKHVATGCVTQGVAMYDCYEKKLCTKDERIWALDDFRVLAKRVKQCVDERVALQKCFAANTMK